LLEQFGNGPMTADAINAATLALKRALIERALGGEMSHHLGYPSGVTKPSAVTNQRNGSGAKTVLTQDGPIRIEVPRDRDGSFEPLLIPKHERHFTGFDDKIVAMYARGMAVRETSNPTICITVSRFGSLLGVVGQHDNYGFALTAQPGGSQGRPTTNTSSRLTV
jgi:transposase-like protein